MAMAKTTRAAQLEQTARRLDYLAENARILRDPGVWEKYREAIRIAGLLGFTVTCNGSRHEVRPC